MKDSSNWFIEFWRAQIGFNKPHVQHQGCKTQDCHWCTPPMIRLDFHSVTFWCFWWIMRCLQVCFCLVPKFLDATLRHFDFMLRGLVGRLGNQTCFPWHWHSFFDESRTKDVLGYLIACQAMYIMKWYDMLLYFFVVVAVAVAVVVLIVPDALRPEVRRDSHVGVVFLVVVVAVVAFCCRWRLRMKHLKSFKNWTLAQYPAKVFLIEFCLMC